jgi:hypothetical protein
MSPYTRPHHILPIGPDPRIYITPSRITPSKPRPVHNPGFQPLSLSPPNNRPGGLIPTIHRTNSGRFRPTLDHEGPVFYDKEVLEEDIVAPATAEAPKKKKKKGILRRAWGKCKKVFGGR